jgi:hypothetical protein
VALSVSRESRLIALPDRSGQQSIGKSTNYGIARLIADFINGIDPKRTLAVHCGNGLGAGFSPLLGCCG